MYTCGLVIVMGQRSMSEGQEDFGGMRMGWRREGWEWEGFGLGWLLFLRCLEAMMLLGFEDIIY